MDSQVERNDGSSADPGDPYCGNCGYALKGLTDSSKCPECGKPLVETLMRRKFAFPRGRRFRSKQTIFGLPVIDVAFGPFGTERIGRARGFVAIGDIATGVLAIGGVTRGLISIGGVAVGLFSVGGLGVGLLTAAAFLIGLFVNPPYKFAPEDNLNYADVVRLHQQAIRQIVTHFPGSTILTAWPATDELTKPELGYVKKPLAVVTVANFSLDEIQKAAASTQDFTVGFAFSTKYDPPRLMLDLGARNEALDTRFFDFHRDLAPGAIAHLLGGRIVWRDDRQGEWAAVLHFNRPQVASLHTEMVTSRER